MGNNAQPKEPDGYDSEISQKGLFLRWLAFHPLRRQFRFTFLLLLSLSSVILGFVVPSVLNFINRDLLLMGADNSALFFSLIFASIPWFIWTVDNRSRILQWLFTGIVWALVCLFVWDDSIPFIGGNQNLGGTLVSFLLLVVIASLITDFGIFRLKEKRARPS